MGRALLLDLFSGAGGASVGYWRAGFDVIGVDLYPMPRFPFDFIQADAMRFLRELIRDGVSGIDAIHASPPCQGYSTTKFVNPRASEYPRLIPELRGLLEQTGLPYVIENVEGAGQEMPDSVTLCGSQFGRRAEFHGSEVYLRRHRLISGNWHLPDAGPHRHVGRAVSIAGHGSPNHKVSGKGYSALCRELMGIDWMTRDELTEAIPPAYAEYVGRYLMHEVSERRQHDLAA